MIMWGTRNIASKNQNKTKSENKNIIITIFAVETLTVVLKVYHLLCASAIALYVPTKGFW